MLRSPVADAGSRRDQNPSRARLTQLTAKIEPADVMTAASERVRRKIRRAMMLHRRLWFALLIAPFEAGSDLPQRSIRMGLVSVSEVQANRYEFVAADLRAISIVDRLFVNPVASVVAAPDPPIQ